MANKHKSSNKKWAAFWIGATAFIVVAAILAGLIGWRTNGYTDWTFGFGKPTVELPNTPDDDKNSPGDGAVISSGESKGISLMNAKIAPEEFAAYGISAQAESAYTLKATVTPAEATDKDVEWTVTPADGKVTVTPTSEDALTAIVECTGAFDVQHIITVKSKLRDKVSASCKVDYKQRVTGINVLERGDFDIDDISGTATWYWQPLADREHDVQGKWRTKASQIIIGYEYSIGTLPADKYAGAAVKMSEELIANFSRALANNHISADDESFNRFVEYSAEYMDEVSGITIDQGKLFWASPERSIFGLCLEVIDSGSGNDRDGTVYMDLTKYAILIEAMKMSSVDFELYIAYSSDDSKKYSVNVDDNSLAILMNGLGLNNSHIII